MQFTQQAATPRRLFLQLPRLTPPQHTTQRMQQVRHAVLVIRLPQPSPLVRHAALATQQILLSPLAHHGQPLRATRPRTTLPAPPERQEVPQPRTIQVAPQGRVNLRRPVGLRLTGLHAEQVNRPPPRTQPVGLPRTTQVAEQIGLRRRVGLLATLRVGHPLLVSPRQALTTEAAISGITCLEDCGSSGTARP